LISTSSTTTAHGYRGVRYFGRNLTLPPVLGRAARLVARRAIRSLPAGQRKVVVLRHIWDCSVEETAEHGVSISTVKSQARDALAALRRALTSDFGTNSLQGEER
jgi:DNA-directed RNA polymerase specialized sigma24 family protein